ncbi:MAG: PTS sugar transporter subunit IIA [Bacillota bacterium]|nr:PTS sugar transporter subunit IIA [Bacillota bacterium]
MSLKNFLPNKFVQIKDHVNTWQEAITIACQPLLESNIIKPSYISALIEENNHQNVYCFIGKNMVIPHAAPEKGVLADAFAMLILKNPIAFENGHKVSIVTPLAIYNQKRHLKALSELVEIAENETKIARLLNAKDVLEAQFIINGCS